QGSLAHWPIANCVVSGISPQISIKGYKFDNINLKMVQGDRTYSELTLSSLFYKGTLDLKTFINFRKPELPLEFSLQLEGADISNLKNDTPLKGRPISGQLNSRLTLQGPLKQPNLLIGDGMITVANGELWQSNLLKGIWALLLIPVYDEIIFTDAYVDFVIKNEKVITDSLTMKSRFVDLAGKGWIGFDQTINLHVQPQFKETEILASESLRKSTTAILTHAADYISVLITGTLSKPIYRRDTLPIKALEKATGGLLQGVQGILEEILE
ncbi:MAG: AsmA-like C-terminal region-containing protein, partial [Candidatus Omnitrophica bacterium]|nr:AsmA-like C-terminal region-containing protein [Candidatus Omnitrophota bacterium]